MTATVLLIRLNCQRFVKYQKKLSGWQFICFIYAESSCENARSNDRYKLFLPFWKYKNWSMHVYRTFWTASISAMWKDPFRSLSHGIDVNSRGIVYLTEATSQNKQSFMLFMWNIKGTLVVCFAFCSPLFNVISAVVLFIGKYFNYPKYKTTIFSQSAVPFCSNIVILN